MPHQKLIARLLSVGSLSEQDRAKLARMPYKLRTLENGEYFARQDDSPAHSSIVMSGFLCRQKVISGRNQISSFYVAGDMPDLHTLHLPVLDHELCSIGSCTVASVSHALSQGADERISRAEAGILARDADPRCDLSRVG